MGWDDCWVDGCARSCLCRIQLIFIYFILTFILHFGFGEDLIEMLLLKCTVLEQHSF